MNDQSRPIGIFDSGLGGLSVLRELSRALPHESFTYFADHEHCPYGTKPASLVEERSVALSSLLVDGDAKLIVVACNTACAWALEAVRASVDVPVIGLEPAVKPAAERTRSGKIGVLATPMTMQSARLRRLISRFGGEIEVVLVPAAGLVELVESGDLDSERVERLVTGLLSPLVASGVDVLVLGCTHYSFLRPVIERVLGPEVLVLDSGAAVARRAARLLDETDSAAPSGNPGSYSLFTTGEVDAVSVVAARLLGGPQSVRSLAAFAAAVRA